MLSFKTTKSFFRNSFLSLRKTDFTEHYAKTAKSFSTIFASFSPNIVEISSNRFKTMTNTMEIPGRSLEDLQRVFRGFPGGV
jgi:hypothetical protein